MISPLSKDRVVRILLVEDDDAHAEIVRRNLSELGMATAVVHLKDGQEALDYLCREGVYRPPMEPHVPDLVLLDLHLPKVDGLEVLKRVKTDENLRKTPVVVLTTSRAERDVVAAYDCGAGSFLVKPVNMQNFAELMKTLGLYWLAWNEYPESPPRGAQSE